MTENDLRLLKMYTALLDNLSVSSSERDVSRYEKQVHKVDDKLYNDITDKIKKNSNYMDYPLERQLEFLLDIEKDYNNYFKFQEEVKHLCEKNNIIINLHNIELIDIEEISKRVTSIKKYLENMRQIGINNDTLATLNEQLIILNNNDETFRKIVDRFDETLRHKILIVSGRIKNNDRNESISIVDEANNLNLDLEKLLDDDRLLSTELMNAEKASNDASEQLKLTVMCNTDGKYEDLYLKALNDDLNNKYKLVFLKIIELISSNRYSSSYEKVREKREKLIELIKKRVSILKDLNITYFFDPFNSLEISSQLKSIESYSDLSEKIGEIVDKINIITSDNDKMNVENKEFFNYLGEKKELLVDETSLDDILGDKLGVAVDKKYYPDNQVVLVSELPVSFALRRASDKAIGVINRVFDMINNTSDSGSSSDVIPNLVIEQKENESVVSNDNFSSLDNEVFLNNTEPIESVTDNEIFLDLPSELGIDNNMLNATFDDDKAQFVENIEDVSDNNIDSTSDQELFSEVSPFTDGAKLFDDRIDGNFEDDNKIKIDLNSSVPSSFLEHVDSTTTDSFWTTKSDMDSSSSIPIESS